MRACPARRARARLSPTRSSVAHALVHAASSRRPHPPRPPRRDALPRSPRRDALPARRPLTAAFPPPRSPAPPTACRLVLAPTPAPARCACPPTTARRSPTLLATVSRRLPRAARPPCSLPCGAACRPRPARCRAARGARSPLTAVFCSPFFRRAPRSPAACRSKARARARARARASASEARARVLCASIKNSISLSFPITPSRCHPGARQHEQDRD